MPTLAAARHGKHLALANKECLVTAGELFMREIQKSGATLLPVDSEHCAAFQAIGGSSRETIDRLILTASGGPFRTWSIEEIADATPEQALKHPNWSMGQKITIDSATLMNKGLELIEAHHLFSMPAEKLDVLVHPQSIVHCLVEWADGSMLAQLSTPDMRMPIAYSLSWPGRGPAPAPRLNLAALGSLSFEKADPDRFKALALARHALVRGGGAPSVLNAANEVAVAAFLERRIGFLDIADAVSDTLESMERQGIASAPSSIDEALELDWSARAIASELCTQRSR
jgi:1-deoxy-D-xylulose-5-phosphate reductoisomerase